MDVKDPVQLARLNRAANDSYDWLGDHRQSALHQLKLFCGQHYNRKLDAGRNQSMNLIRTAITTLASSVTPDNTSIDITSKHREVFPYGLELATATNQVAESIAAQKAIAMAILQTFYSMGIIKVGHDRESAKYFVMEGVEGRLTDMFLDFILFDDWVHDVTARWLPECRFMGHEYALPLERVLDSKEFKNTENLQSDTRANVTASGEVRTDATDEQYGVEDIVYVRELFLPVENVVITTPRAKSQQHRLMRRVDKKDTPFHLLSFFDVLGSVMPLPPGADLIDLHEQVSDAQWKLRLQMLEQKDWWAVQGGSAGDANTILKVRHGQVVKLQNPQMIQEFHSGGPSSQISAFVGNLMNWFNWNSGNINLTGGLAATSETLGQEEILANAASTYQRNMGRRVQGFVTGILKAIAHMVHTDKTIELKLLKRIPNSNISIPFTYKAGKRDGKWLECVFSMLAYGAKHLSPNEQYTALRRLMQDFILPLVQTGQIALKGPEMVREAAKCLGYQQIESVVDMAESPSMMAQEMGSMKLPGKNVYEHVSRPARRPPTNWGDVAGMEGGGGQQGQPAQQSMRMPA